MRRDLPPEASACPKRFDLVDVFGFAGGVRSLSAEGMVPVRSPAANRAIERMPHRSPLLRLLLGGEFENQTDQA